MLSSILRPILSCLIVPALTEKHSKVYMSQMKNEQKKVMSGGRDDKSRKQVLKTFENIARPDLTTPIDMYQAHEADIMQVILASTTFFIATCTAILLQGETQQKSLHTFCSLAASFALKCAASIPICTWLNVESEREYVKLFLISLEVSILLIHSATEFAAMEYSLVEAVFLFTVVAYTQTQLACEHLYWVE